MTFQITEIKKMSQNHGQQGWFHDFQEDHFCGTLFTIKTESQKKTPLMVAKRIEFSV